MGKPSFIRMNWPALGFILGISVLLLFFQNCGQAGTEGSDELSSLLEDSPDVKKFKAAPFPFDINVNQVAYMTCPASRNDFKAAEDVESPFFTIRVGAFDNTSLAARFPTAFGATAVDPDRTARLKAGVGLSKAFLDNIKSSFAARLANAKPEDEKRLIRDAVVNSKYKFGVTGALVFSQRRTPRGFTPDPQHPAKPSFTDLTSIAMANQLADTRDLGTYGREKLGTVTGVQVDQRSMVMSHAYPQDQSMAENFRNELSNLEFAVGYAKPDQATDSFFLESPTEPEDTLYGKSYRFPPLTSIWQGRVDRVVENGAVVVKGPVGTIKPEMLSGVNEYEVLQKGAPVNVSLQQGHAWSCFSLMIVREVDRRDPVTQKLFNPGEYEDPGSRNCNLWTPGCVNKLKYYDYQPSPPNGAIIPGAKVACPIQEVGSSTSYGSINYSADGGVNRMRLEIARRFLAAEYWDINTHPEYMCAVPKPTVQGLGQCYGSNNTDFNGSEYIMYTQTGVELGQNVTCGVNPITGAVNKKCPAFVSICYRTN